MVFARAAKLPNNSPWHRSLRPKSAQTRQSFHDFTFFYRAVAEHEPLLGASAEIVWSQRIDPNIELACALGNGVQVQR